MEKTHIIREERPLIIERNDSGVSGLLVGIVIAIIVILFALIFGLPYFFRFFTKSAPTVQVPSKIDVNLNK